MSKQAGRMSQSANDFLAPSVPTGVTGTDVGTGRAFNNGAIDFSWTQPAGAYSATSYDLTITICNQGVCGTPVTINTGSASTTYRLEGLSSGSDATLQVAAKNAQGTSSGSIASSAVVATTVPQAPTLGAVTNVGTGRPYNDGSFNVTMTPNASGGKAITAINAVRQDNSVSYQPQGSAAGGTFLISGSIDSTQFKAATDYIFRAQAFNANGGSALSAPSAAVTCRTVPATPSAPSASSP